MRLLDPRTAASSEWPAGSERVRAFAEAFAREGEGELIANLRTRMMVLLVGKCALPVTINDAEYGAAYVCSPYTTYVTYAKEELRLIKSAGSRAGLAAVATAAGVILKTARINRMVQVNNWMLSTNLFPTADLPVAAIAEFLSARFPDYFLCFRSLNAWSNAGLMKSCRAAGYRLVASRQVYCYERFAESWGQTHNAKEDRRLSARTEYCVVPGNELGEADYARMAELYRLLYIEKYSHLNPMFTAAYLRLCHQSGVMRFFGLRGPDGILDGVLGVFAIDGIVTAPVVGYDTTRDRRLGLYRLLMTIAFEFASKEDQRLNLSSGAAEFKRLRGGQPVIEYSAIYDRHLSFGRRVAVSALAAVVNGLGVPLMRKLKL